LFFSICQAITTSFRAVATTATFRFFFLSKRRKKTPSGPGWLATCCAAWTSSQRARRFPCLVIGPW